ncbi:serine protease [bacterium]|nr:MAG: serine protease [bacterium]
MKTFIPHLKALALVLCSVIAISRSQTTSQIPETHLNLPVFVSIPIAGGLATASGFVFGTNRGWYFATAKHVLFQADTANHRDTLIGKSATLRIPVANPQDTSFFTVTLSLDTLLSNGRLLSHKTADVALVELGPNDSIKVLVYSGVQILNRQKDSIQIRGIGMLANYADVRIGNTVYAYGYPTSIGLKSLPQFDYNRPLLRRGIVAGKHEARHTIILDCSIYFGNSGGPIVQESMEDFGMKYKIIGIVTELIPFDESKLNRTVPPGLLMTNSGYAVAESADRVSEILKENKRY